MSGQPSREEKSSENSGKQSSEMEKSSKNGSDLIGLTFETIPTIQRFGNYSSFERTISRMIKWMSATPAYKINVDPIYKTKKQ
ncbi:hypothetical protein H5410_015445, partial [Solanum commersonii]